VYRKLTIYPNSYGYQSAQPYEASHAGLQTQLAGHTGDCKSMQYPHYFCWRRETATL